MTRPSIISAYLKLPSVVLVEKVGTAEAMLKSCTLCPRECKVDRSAGKFGFCCDDRIRDFARGLPCPVRVCYHDSLDSALMKYFGDDNIQKMIAILKVRDDEAITHATIDKALRSAQEKLVKQVATDRRADSQDAWFQYNVMRRS